MNREEVLNSIALKKKFCKDCGIPISVYDNPYFLERLSALDIMYGCVDMFERYCNVLEEYNSEQDYFAHYNAAKESMIDAIKKSLAYDRFCSEKFIVSSDYSLRDVYVDTNHCKSFISIDMKKANFSALHHYDPSIFCDYATWEEFARYHSNDEHIVCSKYIRQVVMGACNPKKQTQYERVLMAKLLEHIVHELPNTSVFSLGYDEIILNCGGYPLRKLKECICHCPDGIGSLVRVDMFRLEKIHGTGGWLKLNYDGTQEFKCLNGDTIHQVVKHYYRVPITESDLVFYHNGRLATYLEAIENPWIE